jgi:hypothetical protein
MYAIHMTNKRIAQIDQRIEKIKAALVALGEMRPGSLTRQFKDPEAGTGAYYQLSFTLEMKSRTDYIPRQCVAQIRRQVANYKRFKALSAEWVALGIERSRLQIKLTRIV